MPTSNRFWVVIPAAGVGQRMQSKLAKQYLTLVNKTVIEHTLDCFQQHELIHQLIVATSADDDTWLDLPIDTYAKKITRVDGGQSRHESVLNCLKHMADQAENNDWVLVHDAVRPCLSEKDLSLLIDFAQASDKHDGALLAKPVTDTLKQSNEEHISLQTIDRSTIWQAMTPQMFRYGALTNALSTAWNEKWDITDEASAIEKAGLKPTLLTGHQDNIKITYPDDLELAEFYLRKQGRCK